MQNQGERNLDFIPDSPEKSRYMKPFPTRIYYQTGKIGGKRVIRFYLDDEIVATRPFEQNSDFYFFFIDNYFDNCGGQNYKSAQRQREKALKLITTEFFKTLRFIELNKMFWELKPVKKGSYINSDYKPDLIFEKDDILLIIELKAYHKDTIIAEHQISQIRKYALESVKFDDKKRKRFLLITTGRLLPFKEIYMFGNETTPESYYRDRYKKMIEKIANPVDIDDFERRGMYKLFYENFDKDISLYSEFMKSSNYIDFYSIEITNLDRLKSFFELPNSDICVGFISTLGLEQMLLEKNLSQYAKLLSRISNTPLEMLIIDSSILNNI